MLLFPSPLLSLSSEPSSQLSPLIISPPSHLSKTWLRLQAVKLLQLPIHTRTHTHVSCNNLCLYRILVLFRKGLVRIEYKEALLRPRVPFVIIRPNPCIFVYHIDITCIWQNIQVLSVYLVDCKNNHKFFPFLYLHSWCGISDSPIKNECLFFHLFSLHCPIDLLWPMGTLARSKQTDASKCLVIRAFLLLLHLETWEWTWANVLEGESPDGGEWRCLS